MVDCQWYYCSPQGHRLWMDDTILQWCSCVDLLVWSCVWGAATSETKSVSQKTATSTIHEPPVHCGSSLILEEETEHGMETLTQTSIECWIVLFKRNYIAGLSQVGYGLVGTMSFKATTWTIRSTLISLSRRPVVCWEGSRQCLDEAVNSLWQQ